MSTQQIQPEPVATSTAAHAARTVPETAAAPPPATAVHVPFGDPAGLGLAAFALTTFVLSVVNTGWVNANLAGTVLGLAMFYGGVGQVIAGIWEFANRNTFGAVAFSSYGLFWLSFWYLNVGTKLGTDAATGVGIFLLAWGIFTLYMTIAALKTTLSTLLVFAALTLTSFALAIAELTGGAFWGHLGGYLGLATAILAWYGSFASVTNFTYKRKVIPVWPLG
jgi:succinate-acetate transporter protein